MPVKFLYTFLLSFLVVGLSYSQENTTPDTFRISENKSFENDFRSKLGKSGPDYDQLGANLKESSTVKRRDNKAKASTLLSGNTSGKYEYEGDNIIRTTDGFVIGSRDEILQYMMLGVRESNPELFIEEESEESIYNYMGCIVDNLFADITFEEWESVSEGDNIDSFLFSDNNFELISDCATMYLEVIFDSDAKMGDNWNSPLAVKACAEEILRLDDLHLSYSEAEQYCSCVLQKASENNLSYSELYASDDATSISYNEIVIPCLNVILVDSYSSNQYIPEDILGDIESSIVPLIDLLGTGYNVKVNICGVEKYFLLDTGAADMVISSEIEQQLLDAGQITEDDYLEEEYYTLANNETVKAQLVSIDNIIIGDYTLNNVVVAIIPGGSLLLGTSFFDKFSNWEIDIENVKLVLHR